MWFKVAGRRVVRPWTSKEWTAGECLTAAGFDPATTMLGFYFPAHGMLWFENPEWKVWPMGYRMVITPTPPYTGYWEDRRGVAGGACLPIWWDRSPGCRFCGRSLDHLEPGAGRHCAGEMCVTHTEGENLRGLYALPYHRAVG